MEQKSQLSARKQYSISLKERKKLINQASGNSPDFKKSPLRNHHQQPLGEIREEDAAQLELQRQMFTTVDQFNGNSFFSEVKGERLRKNTLDLQQVMTQTEKPAMKHDSLK
jgi:hypothetical protein